MSIKILLNTISWALLIKIFDNKSLNQSKVFAITPDSRYIEYQGTKELYSLYAIFLIAIYKRTKIMIWDQLKRFLIGGFSLIAFTI